MRPIIVVLGLLATMHAQAGTFADVLEKAWLRLPQAQSEPYRNAAHQANQAAAGNLFPAAPTIGLGQRTDQFNANAGMRELELEVAVPLWLPGEKAARQHLASSESQRYSAEQAALRLQLAGALREAIWQVKLAENAHQQAQNRLANVHQIEADVARRVKAGDLAQTDLLLAQSDTIASQSALTDNARALAAARQAYLRIVGDDVLPDVSTESIAVGADATADIDAHPLLAAKRQSVQSAQAKARLVSETRREHPELSLNTRRERGDFNERYSNTIGVAIRMTFGSDARNAPRIAAAQGDLTEAEVDYQRQRRDIEQAIQQAQLELDLARQRAALATSRAALAQENLQLFKRAFTLGEKSLPELQRVQADAHAAALSASQSTIEIERAIARQQQAMGVMP